MKKGLVIINTGEGKGKSTASFGIAVRALGNGMKVLIRQFIKGEWVPGEMKFFNSLPGGQIDIKTYGDGFIMKMSDSERKKLKLKTRENLAEVSAEISAKKADVIILDEIICLLNLGIISNEDIINLVKIKPEQMHLVLTGRGASEGIIDMADIVTEMKEVKHPYKSGISAQKGIEF